MANELASFLVSIGFKVDTAAQAKVTGAVKKTEAALTKATLDELEKRRQAEDEAAAERIEEAVKTGRKLTAEEKVAAERITKLQKVEEEKRAKDRADRDKRVKDAWTKTQKDRVDALLGVRNAAVKATVAVAAADAGLVALVDRAAKSFERLGYLSQRSGSSATNVSAFGYASGQLGSSNEAGNASLSEFGGKLRKYPGYAEALRGLKIKTEGPNGERRDSADLATDLGDALSHKAQTGGASGYASAIARARMFGFDEDQARAMMNPEFRAREGQFRSDQVKVGSNPDAAAAAGTAFEQAMRHLTEVMSSVGTAIETNLATVLKPQLDALAGWVQSHGKDIQEVVTRFVDGAARLATAFLENGSVKTAIDSIGDGLTQLSKWVGSKDFKDSVQAFTDDVKTVATDIMAFAHAIKSALQWLGIIPSKDAQPGGSDSAGGGGGIGGGGSGGGGGGPGGSSEKGASLRDRAKYGTPLKAGKFADKAPGIIDRLKSDFGLKDDEAAAVLGNLGHESGGFSTYHEGGQPEGQGGIGWAQWTGSRRRDYEAWSAANGLDPHSDEANYGFLRHELKGRYAGSIAAVKQPGSLLDKTIAFEGSYEGAGVKAYGSRYKYAQRALDIHAKADQLAASGLTGAQIISRKMSGAGGAVAHDSKGNPVMVGPDGHALNQDGSHTSVSPFGALMTVDPGAASRQAGPLGVPASMLHLNNSSKGDTTITHNPTFNIQGGDPAAAMSAARQTASRGTQDLLRNVQQNEQ